MENQVSMIINGVRYDSIQVEGKASCDMCDLDVRWCRDSDFCFFCAASLKLSQCFKKSDKKFEV